ncbi:MAG: hypothetical protein WA777_03590 [Rhodanobacter sp.]
MSHSRLFMGRLSIALAFGWLAASNAQADPLTDLRATLARMHANDPFAATLDVRNTSTNGSSDKPHTTHAELQLHVEGGSNGLHIGFAPDLLARASQEAEAHAKNPDVPMPTHDLLNELDPISVQSMLDVAPTLLRKLEGATLSTQRDEMHNGKPTHLLVFNIPPGVSSEDSDSIKHYEGHLNVWLGADGVPVAMEESRAYNGRKFFISFETGMSQSAVLKSIGTRLVAISRRSENKGSGLGQASDSVDQVTLTPVAQGAAQPSS